MCIITALWTTSKHTIRYVGVPEKLVTLLRNLYAQSQLAVKIGATLGESFTAELGTRQGNPISPLSFISS